MWYAIRQTARVALATAVLAASSAQDRAAASQPSRRAHVASDSATALTQTVRFANGPVTLAGTLVTPAGVKRPPAIVIVHGSGPNEGDAYRVYANQFAAAGIAALVYDKRGSGISTGDWRHRTLDDLTGDALAAVRYLEGRSDIDARHIGLWGMSQGSWVVAHAAARASDVAFVITVAGDGVSPTQQEMYHKDQQFRAMGYSDRARDLALRFWRMVFEWLVRVGDGRFRVPRGFMETELSGAYFGLDYDPIPDWERVRQPTLHLYGERDHLTPVRESIARICRAFARSAQHDHTFIVFPGAVHNVTLGTNGMAFAWDTGFAPGYFRTTTDWVLARARGTVAADSTRSSCSYTPSPEFAPKGRYGTLPWYGRFNVQIPAMLLFAIVFLAGVAGWLVRTVVRRVRGATHSPTPARGVRHVAALVCVVDLVLIDGFALVMWDAVFPQGMGWRVGTIPDHLRPLPLLGLASVAATAALLVLLVRAPSEPGQARTFIWHCLLATCAMLFVVWLAYWNLIGPPL